MKVAIYARVSTSDKGQTTDNQTAVLEEWARRSGASEVFSYLETASGAKSERDRPVLAKLFRDAHLRRFDEVAVWSLDRLSREGIGPVLAYVKKFQALGVRLRSHQESWLDTHGPVSELLLAILAWVAEQERNRIRERVNAGLERARKQGRVGGRRPVPLEVEQVRTALEIAGGSYRKAAARLTYLRGTRRVQCSATTLRRFVVAHPELHPSHA